MQTKIRCENFEKLLEFLAHHGCVGFQEKQYGSIRKSQYDEDFFLFAIVFEKSLNDQQKKSEPGGSKKQRKCKNA